MSNTPNLKMPWLLAAQAQKHVTHNDALRALDAVVQLSALDRDLTAPPGSPQDGDRYIVAASATGSWAGKDGQIAAFQDNAWMFHAPLEGWLCWVADEDLLLVFDGTGWSPVSGGGSVNPAPLVGVNTTADNSNRLSVKSDAVLFSHDDITPGSGDIRHKLNKDMDTGTASVLFQTGFSGRAEMGLTGDDDFHFKVSADGTTWNEALTLDRTTARPVFPQGLGTVHGVPENLTSYDKIYLDAVNGDDANDGKSVAGAIKTPARLEAILPIGRKVDIRLLSDITWDYRLNIGYTLPLLQIRGRLADDSGATLRKITVVDAVNSGSRPGCFEMASFANLYISDIHVELATGKNYAFLMFYNAIGFLRTYKTTLTRTGTGTCCLFANGGAFVPSSHSNLTLSAPGYMAQGVAAGADPNADWRYPSNLSAF